MKKIMTIALVFSLPDLRANTLVLKGSYTFIRDCTVRETWISR